MLYGSKNIMQTAVQKAMQQDLSHTRNFVS